MRHESNDELGALIEAFEHIRSDMLALVEESADLLRDIHPHHQASARNLLHYLALRSHDLRPLQARLAAFGLSSLGRAESHVLSAVESVLLVLKRLAGGPGSEAPAVHACDGQAAGHRLLESNTEAVLGGRPGERGVAIMVTMPSEAADDYTLVDRLLQRGMDCMRINCAHDGPEEWASMIGHLRRAQERQARPCRILMDLAGPKIRTGELEPAPVVVKFRPRRDAYGHVIEPARIWLFAAEQPQSAPTPTDAALPLPLAWLKCVARGDTIRFTDARGAARTLRVVTADAEGCWAEARQTCYVMPGTRFTLHRAETADTANATDLVADIGPFEPSEMPISLAVGDELLVTRSTTVGRNASKDERGRVLTPARVGCSADRVLCDARAGDRIWFDDGRIGGVIERATHEQLHVRIVRTPARGARLRREKGINLPDTALALPAMTDKDRQDLPFICQHADMVALSFVNSADDVRELRSALAGNGDAQPAIVLKIETRRGFEHLPAMLLEVMKSPRCAVMIARGDLAVECGFERMAEVQEEILWICEAGHVPVIWATQVLETLAKDGMPSRAEVTDAAMANRAECVMLNKGPYILEALQVLDDILRRMHGHQTKKRSMLRELRIVSSFREARSTTHPTSNEESKSVCASL